MKLSLITNKCAAGDIMPLASLNKFAMPVHSSSLNPLPALKTGAVLADATGSPLFKVVGRFFLAAENTIHAMPCPLLKAERDFAAGEQVECKFTCHGRTLAFITLSDKGFAGLREDKSGPAIASLLANFLPLGHVQGFMLPDTAATLRTLVADLALGQNYDLIITTGGTGLSERDITPEAILPLLNRRLYGFEQAMMLASLAKTPHAAISRAIAGTIANSIIITLPGSYKAVIENLEAVAPAIGHALDKINNDPADCGG